MSDLQEQLKEAQARVKALAGKRDQVIRDAGVEEQKLQQAYENLRQLGVPNPENLTKDELIRLSNDTAKTLETHLRGLLETLDEGEALLEKYNEAQNG